MPEVHPAPVPESAVAGPRSRSRVRYNATLKLVRRAHLFAGLFMIPWVFLYGITAFLFDHPEAFPDREIRTTGPAQAAGTRLEGFPTAPELASRVAEAINVHVGRDAVYLINDEPAVYTRPITVTALGRGREHSVRFEPEEGTAVIRSSAVIGDRPKDWPIGNRLVLADPPRIRLADGVPALLSRIGIPTDTVSIRNPLTLIFDAESGGKRWRVSYDIQSDGLSVQPSNDSRGRFSTRRFLTGLHLAFGYPPRVGSRWLWAVAVDAMSVAMVFWGCSGLLMWWQMKSLRRIELFVLLASVVVAAAMAVGMHGALAR